MSAINPPDNLSMSPQMSRPGSPGHASAGTTGAASMFAANGPASAQSADLAAAAAAANKLDASVAAGALAGMAPDKTEAALLHLAATRARLLNRGGRRARAASGRATWQASEVFSKFGMVGQIGSGVVTMAAQRRPLAMVGAAFLLGALIVATPLGRRLLRPTVLLRLAAPLAIRSLLDSRGGSASPAAVPPRADPAPQPDAGTDSARPI